MSIKKLDDGRYEVDVRPQGAEGKRIRRKFNTKGEAQIFERHILVNYHNKDWVEKPADRRKLTELLSLWWIYHGKSHDRGEIEKGRLNAIIVKLAEVGVIRADQLTKKAILDYRVNRLNEGLKPSSVNRHHAILSGMFTKLIEADEYHSQHPFKDVKQLKEQQAEMAFLTAGEIEDLLQLLDGDNRKAVLVCLATGGRWGEVANLKCEHIINNMLTFMKTKNGKRRTIPISPALMTQIKHAKTGFVCHPNYDAVRNTLRAMKPDLPDGQALHVFRHTFATHFMMNGGNIITLQRILGHSTIQQTMVYAHFAPDFLQDAVLLNPLNGVSI
ncbi:phage integrase [Pectobacterium atrosepticum SCRI1043]|uniref:Phage integrase n=1 Tax=Pectobacterium atrosepticum (strain SCRI 1043 / ATCC BAA-672) TaxID=218491 RepID=Q6D3V6_PECAS|nr:tyrosine-type recombinase/integrase [Pectobacterium atrosepticum]AIK13741.1 phage integrase [Pectobacterium atrosepticum]MCL6315375.1 integrase [Pectobacterium atrosepticum]MCL6320390.1 integrase [Pectobacterium atrosepticum]CAG75538.1 phage integrase [Pectobacterium atrosepticum SCRI1043]